MYREYDFCGSQNHWLHVELTITDSQKIKLVIRYLDDKRRESIPVLNADDWRQIGQFVSGNDLK